MFWIHHGLYLWMVYPGRSDASSTPGGSGLVRGPGGILIPKGS